MLPGLSVDVSAADLHVDQTSFTPVITGKYSWKGQTSENEWG